MGTFTKDLYRRDIGITNQFELLEPISFYSEKTRPGLRINLLPGLISDGDSTPNILKPFVRASDRCYQRGYIFHDALFRLYGYYALLHPGMEPIQAHKNYPNLHESNLLLDEALEVLQLSRIARWKVYIGLELFGSPGSIKDLETIRYYENAWQFVELEM